MLVLKGFFNMNKWDVKTLQEFAKRLKEHYSHTISICNTIDKELNKMLSEVENETNNI